MTAAGSGKRFATHSIPPPTAHAPPPPLSHAILCRYFDQLAAQISEQMGEEVRRLGGALPLIDLFCAYVPPPLALTPHVRVKQRCAFRFNRKRPLDPVSPEDFKRACERMHDLQDCVLRQRASRPFPADAHVLRPYNSDCRRHDEQRRGDCGARECAHAGAAAAEGSGGLCGGEGEEGAWGQR